MKVRGQLSGKHTISLLPPCGFWDQHTHLSGLENVYTLNNLIGPKQFLIVQFSAGRVLSCHYGPGP